MQEAYTQSNGEYFVFSICDNEFITFHEVCQWRQATIRRRKRTRLDNQILVFKVSCRLPQRGVPPDNLKLMTEKRYVWNSTEAGGVNCDYFSKCGSFQGPLTLINCMPCRL